GGGRERADIRRHATPGDSAHFFAAAKHDACQTKIRHEGLRTIQPVGVAFVDFAPNGIKRKSEEQRDTLKVTGLTIRFVRMRSGTEELKWRNRILRIIRDWCRCFISLCCRPLR